MHALGIHTCVFRRRMSLRRERVALAHMPRISASLAPARDRTRMQEYTHAYPFTYPDFASVYIYMYNVREVCVGYIYRRTYPRAHAMATAASSARAIAPTVHIYLYIFNIYIYIHIYTYIYTHTYNPSLLRAAIPAHADARACACPHVCAHTRATARAASNTPPSASRPWWRAARAEKAAHT